MERKRMTEEEEKRLDDLIMADMLEASAMIEQLTGEELAKAEKDLATKLARELPGLSIERLLRIQSKLALMKARAREKAEQKRRLYGPYGRPRTQPKGK